MVLNYLTDIQPIESGKTDAEIASLLNADLRTIQNTPIKELRTLVTTTWGLIVTHPITGNRSGPLIDLYSNPVIPVEFKSGIEKLVTHLDNPTAEVVETGSDPQVAALWYGIVDALSLDASKRSTLDQLHGGRKYGNVTAQDVALARTQWQESQNPPTEFPLRQTLLSVNISPSGTTAFAFRSTPVAVTESGSVVSGPGGVVVATSDADTLTGAKKVLADKILAAIAEYLEASNG